MVQLGTKEIKTERLLLRRFVTEDLEDMHDGWASREECSEYFPWNAVADIADTKRRLQSWIEMYERDDYYQWAIVWKESQKVIGVINLHDVDADYNSAETSYILNPAYWEKGIMTEALGGVLRFGFRELRLNRIYADCFTENGASARVMQKNGMTYEGTARQKYYKNGRYIDAAQYAIVSSDYFPEKEANMCRKANAREA